MELAKKITVEEEMVEKYKTEIRTLRGDEASDAATESTVVDSECYDERIDSALRKASVDRESIHKWMSETMRGIEEADQEERRGSLYKTTSILGQKRKGQDEAAYSDTEVHHRARRRKTAKVRKMSL